MYPMQYIIPQGLSLSCHIEIFRVRVSVTWIVLFLITIGFLSLFVILVLSSMGVTRWVIGSEYFRKFLKLFPYTFQSNYDS